VTLALRTTQPGVTITDSLATVGNISPGATKTATDPFRIVFAPSLADKTPVKFILSARTNGTPAWTDRFTRLAHAPEIEFSVLKINDTGTGNGDGVVQAGETFRLLYRIKNYGTGAGRALNATLVDVSGGNFALLDNTDSYGNIASMASVQNTDGFLLSESSVAAAHNLRLDVTDASGRLWQKTFELRAPGPPVNMVFDPSLGPDRLSLSWDPPAGATDVNRYQVYRSEFAGGPYSLVSIDPVRHTLLLDRGVYPTTRYYYRITSVDVSGNESALSAEFTGSTNPAQEEGWPITMATETVSSPVVGDIDGDHDFELVVGDSKIYAWHHNGVEVRDGDGNAQTWGLFSTLGSSFVSHIALAEVDNVPGFDILAASRDTKQVFAFNYTGSVIAGWPHVVLNAIRAGIVAADIDGDGQKEIIAIDEKGVLYVWHKDGTEYRDGDHDASTNGVFRKFGGCSYQYGCPAVGDIDGDNINEIVVGTQGDSLFVLNANGTSAPGWPQVLGSDVAGSVAVGDLDGNGTLDVVAHEYNGFTTAFSGNGTQMWQRWAPDYLSFSPSPALGDLDNDGKLECVIPGKDRLVYAIRWNGTDLPGWPVTYASTSWTESSPVIADIDHNGFPDVLLGNENRYIMGWDKAGVQLAGFPLAMSDAVRATPLVCDLNKDGNVDVVAAGWDKTVRVWDYPKLFNPQLAPWAKYHANLYNDGNVATPLPTPVGGAMFSFSLKPGRVELVWNLSLEAGTRFNVERAEVVGGVASSYRRVASDLGIGIDGAVRLVENNLAEGARYTFRLSNEKGEIVHESASLYVPVARAGLAQNFPILSTRRRRSSTGFRIAGGEGRRACQPGDLRCPRRPRTNAGGGTAAVRPLPGGMGRPRQCRYTGRFRSILLPPGHLAFLRHQEDALVEVG
jgi:WD40 repeat protein